MSPSYNDEGFCPRMLALGLCAREVKVWVWAQLLATFRKLNQIRRASESCVNYLDLRPKPESLNPKPSKPYASVSGKL